MNAKDFGIPQNRERIFIVSILGEFSYTFPKPFPLTKILSDYLEAEVDEKYYLNKKRIDIFTAENTGKYPRKDRFIENKEIANAITTRAGERPVDNFVVEPIELVPFGSYFTWKDKKGKLNTQCNRAVDENGIALTVAAGQSGNVVERFGNKRLEETLQLHKIDKITIIDSYNRSVHTELAPAFTTRTDASNHIVVAIPEATKKGYAFAEVGDGVYLDRPHQKRGVVQKGMIQTIKTQDKDLGVVVLDGELVRVRKFTPREAFRLMGVSDEDFDKVKDIMSNAQLYKQAGNAIVVDVLYYIFKNLIEEGETNEKF